MNAHPGLGGLLLVVDDEPQVRAALVRCLQEQYEVLSAASGSEALSLLGKHPVDLILSDQRMPDMSGVDFFARTRISHPEVLRILITGYSEPEDMIRSINEAAVYQFVAKPWQPDHLLLIVKRALEGRELARRHRLLSRELKFADDVLRRETEGIVKLLQETYRFDRLIFASDGMAQACNLARKAAVTDLPVLIHGETGTGKELMARAVHFFSQRSDYPFLAQNCGALPDELLHSELFGHKRGSFTGAIGDRLGLFPAADGGTVFLDEISEVSPSFQVSLLRFLQEGEVKPLGTNDTRHCNVRIIAASNRPLKELVQQGKFRQDLYFRLRGFEVDIPPLRERPDDIPVLAEYAAEKYAEAIGRKIAGISQEVMRRLKAHPFPGNVRELENEVRRMVALAEEGEFLSVRHMSPEFVRLAPNKETSAAVFLRGKETLKQKVESLEAELVTQSLLRHKWNHSRAARELGLSRVGLANKIKRYQLDERQMEGGGS
ncbi:DNA-binding transcriptional response regulator, NtrC family, contains REC, AAA-type ATPase, and a Fis-type DNA-binding domains [Solimonas aquatica]|uniref:DNA-binding transcriptional response regulator, NtrC family, contains REC, AAA-type ATPase, and a Fis-type DNA-binding domains n=1 Tax=Solimonas aquatica TaxID=489703 RepID=A0A1H9FXA5_9GAMM|nr:sigma-54 dependent transcriptional regulator [Solimonas aquatica]SEQ42536.1 DNA-binding transcriptional response regulator, NtrC family, contains REC, AAA-type ATPase, and a Fis-type DNA-binding domains [Solimonas aquatica]